MPDSSGDDPWIPLDLPFADSVSSVALSDEGRLALSSWDGSLAVFDCNLYDIQYDSKLNSHIFTLQPPLLSVAWMNSTTLLSCGPSVGLVQITFGESVDVKKIPTSINPVSIAITDSYICLASWSTRLLILSRSDFSLVRWADLPEIFVSMSASGNLLVVACQSRYILTITDQELGSPSPKPTYIESPLRHATSTITTKNGNILVGSLDGRLGLITPTSVNCWHGHRRGLSRQELERLPPDFINAGARQLDSVVVSHPVTACKFIGRQFITGGCDGAVFLWLPGESNTPLRVCLLQPQRPSVTALDYKNGVLVVASGDAQELGKPVDRVTPRVRILYLTAWIADKVGR